MDQNLLSTPDVLKAADCPRHTFEHILRKYRAVLIPARVIGRWRFWAPGTPELVRDLRARLKPQPSRKAKP